MMNRTGLFLFVFFLLAFSARSQNNTASPYSVFGIGEPETGTFGQEAGMGGVGIGMRTFNTLNTVNPAALIAIDRKLFLLDAAMTAKFSWFDSGKKTDNSVTGNLRGIGFGFRLSDQWALGGSVTPLSNVGYLIRQEQPVEGSLQTQTTTFEGTGGLTRFRVGVAWNFLPGFTLGVNANLAIGEIAQTETQGYWTIERSMRTHAGYFDFGMQYTTPLSARTNFTLGATGGYKVNLPMNGQIYTTDYDGSVIQDRRYRPADQALPEFYGLGMGLENYHKGWTLGVDYRFDRWSQIRSHSSTVKMVDAHSLAAGFSIIPNSYGRSYLQRVKYQAGARLNNSYIQVNGKEALGYGLSLGGVFPVLNRSSINAAFEYGKMGQSARGGIREQYFKITLGFSLMEVWFVRFKFD